MNIYAFVYSVCSLFQAYILYRYYHIFFHKSRVPIFVEYGSYLVFFSVNALIYILVSIPLVILITNIVGQYLLTYVYEGQQKNRIALSLLYCFVAALIELIVVFLSTYTAIPIDQSNSYSLIYGPIFTTVFMYLFVFILGHRESAGSQIKLPLVHWLFLLIIPVASFYMILMILSLDVLDTRSVAVCCFLALLINLAAFYLYDMIVAYASGKIEKQQIEQENAYYSHQLEIMDSFLSTMGGFRHDLKNHVIAMDVFIAKKQYQELEFYFHETFSSRFLENEVIFSGNTTIDSILNYKFHEAKNRGIRFDIHLAIPEKLEISNRDCVIILGNLLDNAIEAAEKVPEPRTVDLDITWEKGCLYITVVNPYIGEMHFKNGLPVTTKADTASHGIGLTNVKEAVERNHGAIRFEDKDHICKTEVVLFPQ